MKKNIARLFVGLLIIVFALGAVSPAFAKPEIGCIIQIVVSEGTVPLEISYEVKTSIPGDPMVIFGDQKPNQIGRTGTHLYEAVGEFIPKALISEDGSLATTCRFYSVKVHPASSTSNGFGGGMDFPEEIPSTPTPVIAPVSSITTGNISADLNEMGENTGENSFGVVNTGEGDVHVTIEQAPQPVATPAPIMPVIPNSCNGFCASNGGTININPPTAQSTTTVKTMPTSFWAMFIYSIIDGFTSPGENWKVWFVENY